MKKRMLLGALSLLCLVPLFAGCAREEPAPLKAVNLVTLEEIGEVADFAFAEDTLCFTLGGKAYAFAMEPLPTGSQPEGATAYYGAQGELECAYTKSEESGEFTVRVLNRGIFPNQYETDPDTFLLLSAQGLADLREARVTLVDLPQVAASPSCAGGEAATQQP